MDAKTHKGVKGYIQMIDCDKDQKIEKRCGLCEIGIGVSGFFDKETGKTHVFKHTTPKALVFIPTKNLTWVWYNDCGIKEGKKVLRKGYTYGLCDSCLNLALKKGKNVRGHAKLPKV